MLRGRRENKTAQKLPDVLELVNVAASGEEVKYLFVTFQIKTSLDPVRHLIMRPKKAPGCRRPFVSAKCGGKPYGFGTQPYYRKIAVRPSSPTVPGFAAATPP
jgi:hypothetical protein